MSRASRRRLLVRLMVSRSIRGECHRCRSDSLNAPHGAAKNEPGTPTACQRVERIVEVFAPEGVRQSRTAPDVYATPVFSRFYGMPYYREKKGLPRQAMTTMVMTTFDHLHLLRLSTLAHGELPSGSRHQSQSAA